MARGPVAIKFQGFSGRAPLRAPELLGELQAQVATNCKLYSGDLIPHTQPVVAANSYRTGEVKSLYAFTDPDTGELVWTGWNGDVSAVRPVSGIGTNEQRVYFTGDGAPKVTTYAMATSGSPPYPTTSYDLGLPLPTTTLQTSVTEFTPVYLTSYARDANGTVTVTTGEAHNLIDGAYASVSGFTRDEVVYSASSGSAEITITYTSPHGLRVGDTVSISFLTATTGDTADMLDTTYTIVSVGVGGNTFVVEARNAFDSAQGGTATLDLTSFNGRQLAVTIVDDYTFTYYSPGFERATQSIGFDTSPVTTAYSTAAGTIDIVLTQGIGYPATLPNAQVHLEFHEQPANSGTYQIDSRSDGNKVLTVSPVSASTVGLAASGGVSLSYTYTYVMSGEQDIELTETYIRTGTYTYSELLLAIDTATSALVYNDLDVGQQALMTFAGGDPNDANDGAYELLRKSGTTWYFTAPSGWVDAAGTVDVSRPVSESSPVVDLSGAKSIRTYLYTWYTPWGEESIGSEPSSDLFIRNGQIVTLTGVPAARPAGDNFIRGVRLYRLVTSASDSGYLRMATLWFPASIVASVARIDDVATITTSYQHNLAFGDRIRLDQCSVADFDGELVVDAVSDPYTFTCESPGSDVAETTATGTLYYDIAYSEQDPRYWGYGGDYVVVDDYPAEALSGLLASTNYAPPPENLRGLTYMPNRFLAGFVGNTVYFSDIDNYHAWPVGFAVSLEHTVVGMVAIGGNLLVLTDSYPYQIIGRDPAIMLATRIDAQYPCLSSRSIVASKYGAMWATHEGIATWRNGGGIQLLTQSLYDVDTWNAEVDPTTVVAVAYNDSYVAWHSAGAFMLTRRGETIELVDLSSDVSATASFYDPIGDAVYLASGTVGDVYRWDDLTQPARRYTWKSRVIESAEPINMGALIVNADTGSVGDLLIWGEVETTWAETDVQYFYPSPVQITIWADGEEITSFEVFEDTLYRLPAGYKARSYEVQVEAETRVQGIRMARNASGLRAV
jgi:hypothetical protein